MPLLEMCLSAQLLAALRRRRSSSKPFNEFLSTPDFLIRSNPKPTALEWKMAIVDGCPGLACEIVVDGQAVTEYLDEDEPEANNTVIRYVEAQSGKVFAIKSKFNDLFPQKLAVKASFFLDGRWTQNKNYTPERLKGDHICKGPVSTIGNQSFQQNYMFKELVTSKF
jgi:hypothetical protein